MKDVPRDAYGNPLPIISPESRARAEQIWAKIRVSDREVDWSQAPEATREDHGDVLKLLLLRIHEARQRQHEQLHGTRVKSKLAALAGLPNL